MGASLAFEESNDELSLVKRLKELLSSWDAMMTLSEARLRCALPASETCSRRFLIFLTAVLVTDCDDFLETSPHCVSSGILSE